MSFCNGDLVYARGIKEPCVVVHAGRFSSSVRRGAKQFEVWNEDVRPVLKVPFEVGDRVVHRINGVSGAISAITQCKQLAIVVKDTGGTVTCYLCNLRHETINQEKEPTVISPTCPALTPKEDRLTYHLDEATKLRDELIAEQAAAEQKKKDAEAAAVKAAAKAAKLEEIKKLKRLHEATGSLLNKVDDLAADRLSTIISASILAEFRNELQPLANSLGYSIVLVGNKSAASLVQL